MPQPALLGIDVGTYETKASLTTTTGELLATESTTNDVRHPQPGWAEHDAQRTWWAGLCSTVDAIITGLDPATWRVAALAVSGIGPCVLPVTDELTPLRPAILYGIDTRGEPQIAELNTRLGAEAILRRCGNTLTSQSAGPKIAWIVQNEPGVAAATATYLTCQSYLVARLTGTRVVDHLTASYSHPFYRLDTRVWDVDELQDIVRPDQLPALAWAGELAGMLTEHAAAVTGLPVGIPVAVGTSDAPAEALAAGVRYPGQLMAMYGSSGFLIAPIASPQPDPSLYTAPGLTPGSWIQAAGTSSAGTATRWVLRIAGRDGTPDTFAELARLAATSPPGARGILFLAHLAGERTPVNDPTSRGAFIGLGLQHTPADLARAVLEGVAHAMAWAIDSLTSTTPVSSITAIGGGTRNPVWTQALTDITGLPQDLVLSPGASVGDAWLAGSAADLLTDRDRHHGWAPTITSTITPDPATAALYQTDQRRYRALYEALATVPAPLTTSPAYEQEA